MNITQKGTRSTVAVHKPATVHEVDSSKPDVPAAPASPPQRDFDPSSTPARGRIPGLATGRVPVNVASTPGGAPAFDLPRVEGASPINHLPTYSVHEFGAGLQEPTAHWPGHYSVSRSGSA